MKFYHIVFTGLLISSSTFALDLTIGKTAQKQSKYQNDPKIQDDCPLCQEPSCDGQLSAGGDWLYWKVTQEGLIGAANTTTITNGSQTLTSVENIQPDFKYHSGFRINLDYKLPCDRCELSALYTYITLDANPVFETASSNQIILPNVLAFPVFTSFVGQGFGSFLESWTGHLAYLDIDLARKLTFSYAFHLKPHIGFRAAWMKQRAIFEGVITQPTPPPGGPSFISSDMADSYQGYGLEGGIWADWQVGYGLGLLGHFGGSLLYSSFKTNIFTHAAVGEGGPSPFSINSANRVSTATPTLEFFAGVNYEKSIDHFYMSFRAGWEERVFFSVNQLSFAVGNLCLQGISLGGNIGYQF